MIEEEDIVEVEEIEEVLTPEQVAADEERYRLAVGKIDALAEDCAKGRSDREADARAIGEEFELDDYVKKEFAKARAKRSDAVQLTRRFGGAPFSRSETQSEAEPPKEFADAVEANLGVRFDASDLAKEGAEPLTIEARNAAFEKLADLRKTDPFEAAKERKRLARELSCPVGLIDESVDEIIKARNGDDDGSQSQATQLDDQFHETDHGTGNLLADSSFVVDRTRSGIMAGWRQAVALAMTGEEIEALTALSRSRTEPAGRVSRAAMLLGYREKPSFFAVGRRLGVHHQTVQRCVERAMAYGALAALDDRPRPGKEPTITPEAKAWLVSLACDKAKEHGYPHELWTTRLLARHARERGPAAGHQCLARLAQGTVCKLLGQEEIKPHKVRYYLERRDAEFEPKMAEVLCVYREVQVLKKAAAKAEKSKKPVAIVSYDEKPGIQAIATTAPDLPPVPGRHASFARDHEYKRHGTLSLLAGIDLLTGKVHALVRERHRSREFIEFLKLLDAAYPASTAIKLILDNHSAHISRETRAWLDTRPPGRFDFTFTPKHGSWLNLIEGFFSKFARAVLRHIRVTSKQELKERIMAGIRDVNRHPVIHTWSYKLAEAA